MLVAHDLEQALRRPQERAGVAVLLRAPSPADVAAVARAGARMPRKSTLFVPKPRTGLVLPPARRLAAASRRRARASRLRPG